MPRFVVLHHQTPVESDRADHWDFMLEAGSVLRTWALADRPRRDVDIDAELLSDHRLAYLNYEGPLSQDRGGVNRWDRGDYEMDHQTDDEWVVTLRGEKLRGTVAITRRTGSLYRWRLAAAR